MRLGKGGRRPIAPLPACLQLGCPTEGARLAFRPSLTLPPSRVLPPACRDEYCRDPLLLGDTCALRKQCCKQFSVPDQVP